MYMNFVEAAANPGKRRAFLEREDRFHELLARQRGILAGIAVHSLGSPAKFARATIWDSPESAEYFVSGADMEAFFEANPIGNLASVTRSVEGYELALEVGEPARSLSPGMHIVTAEWTLDIKPGFIESFERSRKELFELRRAHSQGFVRSSLYRFMGAPNRYLAVNTCVNRTATLGSMNPAPIQSFAAAYPASMYTGGSVGFNAYEVTKVTRSG